MPSGNKPLPKPMLTRFMLPYGITRPHWVKTVHVREFIWNNLIDYSEEELVRHDHLIYCNIANGLWKVVLNGSRLLRVTKVVWSTGPWEKINCVMKWQTMIRFTSNLVSELNHNDTPQAWGAFGHDLLNPSSYLLPLWFNPQCRKCIHLPCYTPTQRSSRGVYWFHLVRLSVCPSVDRIVSVLYLQQYFPFHIYTCYQATSKGVSFVKFMSKFQNCNFWQII